MVSVVAVHRTWLLHSIWDLSSQIRDRTCVPYIVRQIFNHGTTREVPDGESCGEGGTIIDLIVKEYACDVVTLS